VRILIGSDFYPPVIGGGQRQTQLLARGLAHRGHAVMVATVWHPGTAKRENDCGVEVHRLKELRNWLPRPGKWPAQSHQPPYPDPVTTWGLWQLIERWRPDVVHSTGWLTFSMAVALAGKRTPLVFRANDYCCACATRTLLLHGTEPCAGPSLAKCPACAAELYGGLKGWVSVAGVAAGRLLLRRKVRAVQNVSTYMQEMVRRDLFGGPPSGVVEAVLPGFGESSDVAGTGQDPSVMACVDLLPNEPYMMFVGALRRVKGIAQLLAAYQQLALAPPLVLIGTLEADAPKVFPPGVVVLQNFPHAAVMAAWERSLFGVFPSLWPEPSGNVVYEAMSKGKAVIGTVPGGHADMIVDGQTGFLVPAGDVDALTSAMRTLLEDPLFRERAGAAALERSREFNADVVLPRLESLLVKVAQAPASTPSPVPSGVS